MLNGEKKIIIFCEKHATEIFLVIITVLAAIARVCMFDYKSGDYLVHLSVWFDELKNAGGIKGLVNYKGDYNYPYVTIMAILTYLPFNSLYSLKTFSVIFDFLLAISAGSLTNLLSKDKKKTIFVYSFVLFIPSVLFNGAMWGQCDSIYAFFVVLSLIYLLKEDYFKSFIFLGIAFSFKLQGILIIPVYIIYYVCKKKFSFLYFLLIPIINIILCIPSILVGVDIRNFFEIYLHQTNEYIGNLTLNFINIYSIFNGQPQILSKIGIIATIVICTLTLLYCIFKKPDFSDEQTFTLGMWFLIIETFILPSMHERYLFLGEALAVIYLLVYKKNVGIMSYVILSPLLTYGYYFFGTTIENINLLAVLYFTLIIKFTINTFELLDVKKDSNYEQHKFDK